MLSPTHAPPSQDRTKVVIVTIGAICLISLLLQWSTFAPGVTPEASAMKSGAEMSAEKIANIKKHAGLYLEKLDHSEFSSTVLVIFVDALTRDFLHNWECAAMRFGLDWVVIAMDVDELIASASLGLDADRVVTVTSDTTTGGRMPHSCLKTAVVLQILRLTGLDIVVSDAANVFHGDPFKRGVSLGDMVRSLKFDYIYQPHHRDAPSRDQPRREGVEATTGFYFLAGSRKQDKMYALLESVLAQCKGPSTDNATFNLLHSLVTTQKDAKRHPLGGFKCNRLCASGSACTADSQDALEYCDMDPWSHASGWRAPKPAPKPVTYHASASLGTAAKIEALRSMNLWDFFDPDSQKCTRNEVDAMARDCLRMSSPGLEVSYPEDAEQHFEDIQRQFARWRKDVVPHCVNRYCGPWVENIWISHFEDLWRKRSPGTSLRDVFGPYVPLLFPWVDFWVKSFHYPAGFVEHLKSILRPGVAYITVSQNDEGLTGKCELLMSNIPNVLVLSAGGYGHVAVPLMIKPEPINNDKPVAGRKHLVTYVGDLTHGPERVRQRTSTIVEKLSSKLGFHSFVGKSDTWRHVMADSRASLCPRGFGRSAYHVVEIIQMGLVPIYVYTDTAWVPYPDLFDRIGFVANLSVLPDVLEQLHGTGVPELQRREALAVKSRATHFSPGGLVEQIARFMTRRDGGGDLRCRPLPADPRGMGSCSCEGHEWCSPSE